MSFLNRRYTLSTLFFALAASALQGASSPAAIQSVLIKGVEGMQKAGQTFVKDSAAYDAVIARYNGDYEAAYKAEAVELKSLVEILREDFNAMDTAYLRVKSIVGGVPAFRHFAVYLDRGTAETVANPDSPVALYLRNGEIINQEGALLTHVIQPLLWGSNPKWVAAIDLNDDGKITSGEALPRTEALSAAAADAQKKIGELLVSGKNWQPTSQDCFDAVIAGLSQLPAAIERWKTNPNQADESGLLPALQKSVEFKGLVEGIERLYDAVEPLVRKKDKALSQNIEAELKDLRKLTEQIAAREKETEGKLTAEDFDAFAQAATERGGRILPQVQQAGA